jgi:hypothetical protein
MYENKGASGAALFGREMSKQEAQGIVQEVAVLADKVDRLLAAEECLGLAGNKGRGDLRAYWTSLFQRDLDEVLRDVANHYYLRPEDSRTAAESWKYALYHHTRELLTYGMIEDCEFLERAEQAIATFSKPYEIYNPAEPRLTDGHAIRRLAQLEDLFVGHPEIQFPIKSVFVTTEEHGVVTVSKYQTNLSSEESQFSIGMNILNLRWPYAGFTLDPDGKAGPLFLKSPTGEISTLKRGMVPPTTDALIRDVIAAVQRDASALSFDPPQEPNLRWFLEDKEFRQA